MNTLTKTLLIAMTMSVFFALFQLLLKQEVMEKSNQNSKNINTKILNQKYISLVRSDSEKIPDFVSRYKIRSFELWEQSSNIKIESILK